MAIGWVKIYRSINEWGWKKDPNVMALWIHLLANANFDDSFFLGVLIKKGSCATGLISLAEKTGLTVSQVRTCLNKLKLTGEIAIKSGNKFSIISITKWEDYQVDSRQDDKPIANQSQTDDKPIATSKETNKLINKEDKKERATPPSSGISFRNWLEDVKKTDTEVSPTCCPDILYDEADKIGFAHGAIDQWEKFHDHWIAQSGGKAIKADWIATWRNWLRRDFNGKK